MRTDELGLTDIERAYREHRRDLLRMARRLVGPAEAESVLQEVFVELLRNAGLRARFTGGSLGAWLSEITRFKVREYLRRHGRQVPQESVDAASSPESDLIAREVVNRFVETCVPEPQRPFFRLRFIERHTQIEAATALRVPRSTVEGWEHRLAASLRRFIMEETE